jgi:hypothetical protein
MNIKFNAWDKFEKKMILWNELCVDDQLLADIILNNTRYIPLQFINIEDINGKELFVDDLIQAQIKEINYVFRIYFTRGGFAIKAPYWSENNEDLTYGDELILTPLTDAQTIAFVKQNCKKVGNIYEGLKIDL